MMDRFNLKLGLQVVLILVLFFALHLGLSVILGIYSNWESMGISLFGIYAFGFVLTCLIYVALIGIQFSMPQNVGYVFLGLIAVRGIASYLLIDRYMGVSASGDFLKYNFFASFMIFLLTDAFMAYRVLNK
ncbi:hypothetical protein [Myroides guanonis]|uniref:Uncharacterized protein n=1 Tax=Myroides guanonis TaxID=1150112 RepID=A0A1I3RFR2_9FLAO|nr:hypothetical protein [Myroides guanonis]SFJ45095.1 hypothetical protein SAMN04487893_1087 [Myroides guanonis]